MNFKFLPRTNLLKLLRIKKKGIKKIEKFHPEGFQKNLIWHVMVAWC